MKVSHLTRDVNNTTHIQCMTIYTQVMDKHVVGRFSDQCVGRICKVFAVG